jgi:CheY-like chemotaxis protein
MSLTDARILVVEDDPMMRTFTTKVLNRLGFLHVKESADGTEALTQAVRFQPDLILTDVHMKPMNGLEFVKTLRSLPNPEVKKARVIFMSSDSSQETLGAALPLGIAGYIVKPPRLEDMKAKIEGALKRR